MRRRTVARRLRAFFDVRDGEGGLAAQLVIAAFAVISGHYFLKPVAKSLFLRDHGSSSLPDAYIAVAIVTAFAGSAYGALARRLPLRRMLLLTLGVLAAGIVAFRVLFEQGAHPLTSKAFYIYASTYGVLAPAMLWLAVSQVLEPRQARRLMGFVGAGAIAGGIAAGYIVHVILDAVGVLNLLWGATAWVLLAIACLQAAARRGIPGARTPPRGAAARGTLRLIVSHRYLRLLTGLIAVVMMVATLAEYLFLWAVERHVAPGAATADFVATWYSNLNLICLPLQFLVTAPLLRRLGVGPALLVLPLTLTAVATGMALWPLLAFGVSMKVGESALRYSVNKSAIELLYLPLPGWLKDRTKVFVDTVVDRLAKGVAGLLLKGLLAAGATIHVIAAVTALLCATWAAGSFLIRRRYVDAFRDALDRGGVDLKTERIRLDETGALTAVGRRLSGPPALVRQALDVLVDGESTHLQRLEASLVGLAGSDDDEIATRALCLLARHAVPPAVEAARARLDDPSPRVAAAAAEVLLAASPDRAAFFADRSRLGAAEEATAAAAMFALGEDAGIGVIERLLADPSPAAIVAREELGRTLTAGRLPQHRHLLRRLMADAETSVAVEAIRGAGSLRDEGLLPFLVAELRRAAHRSAAREALSEMGEPAIAVLERWFFDTRVEHTVREHLPRAIEDIGGEAAITSLYRCLLAEDPELRHQVLRSLNRLTREGRVRVPDAAQRAQLLVECRALAELLAMQAASPAGGGPCRRLHSLALDQAVQSARQRAFRVLGLKSQGRHWANAFAGLVSGDARLRASAIEFADGSLPDRLRRLVVPLVDDIPPEDAVRRAGPSLGVLLLDADEAILAAARGPDAWLAACALHVAAEERRLPALSVATARKEDDNIWVRDAALAATRAFGPLPA